MKDLGNSETEGGNVVPGAEVHRFPWAGGNAITELVKFPHCPQGDGQVVNDRPLFPNRDLERRNGKCLLRESRAAKAPLYAPDLR